ncbi:hypothetical protein RRG08_033960 [Elysia crispata]|uniref:Uncharacterized protein n=1 Tax=Elysia crispata TaxID=231223 RepID=A0AAE0YS14_9GAST|nr:hypothetical protein RRG08_033960 [Elysia crispata]
MGNVRITRDRRLGSSKSIEARYKAICFNVRAPNEGNHEDRPSLKIQIINESRSSSSPPLQKYKSDWLVLVLPTPDVRYTSFCPLYTPLSQRTNKPLDLNDNSRFALDPRVTIVMAGLSISFGQLQLSADKAVDARLITRLHYRDRPHSKTRKLITGHTVKPES